MCKCKQSCDKPCAKPKQEVDVWEGVEFEIESDKEWSEFLGRDKWMPIVQKLMQACQHEGTEEEFIEQNASYLMSLPALARDWGNMPDDWGLDENGEAVEIWEGFDKEWMKGEREADLDLIKGNYEQFDTIEEMIADLDKDSEDD